jgi:hypothetical protein
MNKTAEQFASEIRDGLAGGSGGVSITGFAVVLDEFDARGAQLRSLGDAIVAYQDEAKVRDARVRELEEALADARAEPQPFGHETGEPWAARPTANALAVSIAELATNDRTGLIQRVRDLIIRDRRTEQDKATTRLAAAEATVGTLRDLRTQGWSVAVHNDYRLDGLAMTFWLFTHPDGRWVKGEGLLDADALTNCARDALSSAPAPGEDGREGWLKEIIEAWAQRRLRFIPSLDSTDDLARAIIAKLSREP